jgi:hypothetical protein
MSDFSIPTTSSSSDDGSSPLSNLVNIEFVDLDGTPYGHQLKAKYFYLGEDYLNLNAGSYGTVPRPVKEAQDKFFLMQERHPDKWFRKTMFDYIAQSRGAVARFINAPVEDIVLVENASSAVNSLLRSYDFKVRWRVFGIDALCSVTHDSLAIICLSVAWRSCAAAGLGLRDGDAHPRLLGQDRGYRGAGGAPALAIHARGARTAAR